jgi:hypothetical protein
VLAPWTPDADQKSAAAAFDLEAGEGELGAGESWDQEDDDGEFVPPAPGFSPALDPRAMPPSIGLTFVVEAGGDPRFSLCVTAARYVREETAGPWQRQPFGWVRTSLSASCSEKFTLNHDVRVTVRSTRLDRRYRISVYLTNVADPGPPDKRPPTSALLFQPQIRVCVDRGTLLASVTGRESEEDGASQFNEEESLRLLYHDAPILARGHMCGALWAEVDPEHLVSPNNPFVWVDSDSCPVEHRERFLRPDLRTDFLPSVVVSAPSVKWDENYGPEPERDAETLADSWQPERLGEALRPLLEGYGLWIRRKRQEKEGLPPALQTVAEAHMKLCEDSLRRMRAGLDALLADPQARLAFCFANRAMALQASWKRGARSAGLRWHPFQLGFILQSLRGIIDPGHPDRRICDLLWFPTGGGKTEAYLGLTAFTLALRRLRASPKGTETGVGVISRYTLRLLTIQQFRRALRLVTACEFLRVQSGERGLRGWRPRGYPGAEDWLWGKTRFAAGLWVGGGVTPNRLRTTGFPDPVPGALDLLTGRHEGGETGEPAQVLDCPACATTLAVPRARHERQERPPYPEGSEGTLHLVFSTQDPVAQPAAASISNERVAVADVQLHSMASAGHYVLSVRFVARGGGVSAQDLDRWWDSVVRPCLGKWVQLGPARASRPGYFVRTFTNQQRRQTPWTFEIYCPNPECPLASTLWRETVPVAIQSRQAGNADEWQQVLAPFQSASDPSVGVTVPIPALTVDDQIYARPPSLLVATVDKFARLAYEPRAAGLFGHVERYHARDGYYRTGCPANPTKADPDNPAMPSLAREVKPLPPPDLVLQDELHLIDGPLGSMVGIYEAVIDALCESRCGELIIRPKYIASTATVRAARDQVRALFCRDLAQFPAPGLSATDSFFARIPPADPLDESWPGRLYVGYCAPGKGGQTPLVHLFAVLLQAASWLRRNGIPDDDLDPYWTLVGYFNAVRELAGATGLYRQDIPQRLEYLAGPERRRLEEDPVELSSRSDSLQLPALLSRLEVNLPYDPVDAVLATSMFGTGVDVPRLSLMVVHGQPKTTSSYIQATGRVGRQRGGLVVTLLRASRPRDLDHYEFFTGYHRQLYRGVEPVTVFPFSPRARERALGPVCVALLRQSATIRGEPVHPEWRKEARGSQRMLVARRAAEVIALAELLEERAAHQPDARRPPKGKVGQEVEAALDAWKHLVARNPKEGVLFVEYALTASPSHPVVLGDAQHVQRQLEVAYPSAPQSLRDVEATTGFRV